MDGASGASAPPRRERAGDLRRRLVSLTVALLLYAPIAAGTVLLAPPGVRGFVMTFVGLGMAVVMFAVLTITGTVDLEYGSDAERRSSNALRRLEASGWRVVDHVPFVTMDIDHVAVGPHGVVAVQTASLSPQAVGEDGEDPLDEALRRARRGARRIRLLLKGAGIDAAVAPALAVWGTGSSELSAQTLEGVSILVGRDEKQWRDQLPATGHFLTQPMVVRVHEALSGFARRPHPASRGLTA